MGERLVLRPRLMRVDLGEFEPGMYVDFDRNLATGQHMQLANRLRKQIKDSPPEDVTILINTMAEIIYPVVADSNLPLGHDATSLALLPFDILSRIYGAVDDLYTVPPKPSTDSPAG
jgi:hypothetical protein